MSSIAPTTTPTTTTAPTTTTETATTIAGVLRRIDSSMIYGRVVPGLGIAAFAASRLFGAGNPLAGLLLTALWVTAATGWLFCGPSRRRVDRWADRAERHAARAQRRAARWQAQAEQRRGHAPAQGGVVLGEPAATEPQDVLPGERGQARMPY